MTDDKPLNIRMDRLLPWLLVLIGFLLYVRSLFGPFVYDDEMHILENPAIRHLDQVGRIWESDRRKVVAFSLAITYAIDGEEPRLFHLFNVTVHVLAGLTLYGLVRRTLLTDAMRDRFGDRAHGLAFAVALLWMVHPLCTQAVAYVIQRGESLMALFYLLTLYCVVRGWNIAAVIAALLGVASKEVMVTVPVLVWLYDRTFMSGSFAAALRRRWPLYVGLCTTWLFLALTGIDTILTPGADAPDNVVGFKTMDVSSNAITPVDYLVTQSSVLVHYLRLCFWPHPLVFDYAWPTATRLTEHWPQSLFMIALAAATLWAIWRKPAWGFLGAWFFVILAPTSSFVPIRHMIFEYRMYLPLAGIMALVVFAADTCIPRRDTAIMLLLIAAAALGLRTVMRLGDYQSPLALWQTVVDARPHNAEARVHLGNSLKDEGDLFLDQGEFQSALAYLEAAGEQYALALEDDTNLYEAAHNLALLHLAEGDTQQAKHWFEKLLALVPDDFSAHYHLGQIAMRQSDMTEAERYFRRAIQLEPEHVASHDMLGVVFSSLGRYDDAVVEHQRTIEIDPGYAISHHNLGQARLKQGRTDDAIRHLQRAVELSPENPRMLMGLGTVQLKAGRIDQARRTFDQALRLAQSDLNVVRQLAWLFATHPDERIRSGSRAVKMMEFAAGQTQGKVPQFLDGLAVAYAETGRFDDAVQVMQQAMRLLNPDNEGDRKLKAEYDARLALYRANKPYRESP